MEDFSLYNTFKLGIFNISPEEIFKKNKELEISILK